MVSRKVAGSKQALKIKHHTIIPLKLVQQVSPARHCSEGKAPSMEKRPVEKSGQSRNGAGETVEDNIRALISHMSFDDHVPLYVSTISGKLVYVNQGYRDLVSTCEHTGRPDPGHLEDETRLPPGLLAILHEVQLTRQNVSVEEVIRQQGVPRHYRSRHFPICDEDGHAIAVGGTYVDCTDKIRILGQESLMQERFRDFARATSDWYWEIDRDYQITYVSDRLTALTDQPGFLMLGKRFEDFGQLKTPDGNQSQTSDNFLAAMQPFRDQLFLLRNKAGDITYNHLSGVPLFDSVTGDFTGYRGAGMDVTAGYQARMETLAVQKSLEHTLEELTNKNIQLDMASAESQAALGAKSEFLAAMSHELRTPLNAIIGFAEAMKMQVFGDLNPQYITYSQDIMAAGNHLLELINDVLDVAVLESGKLMLDMENVSLKDILAKASNLVTLRARQKHIDITQVCIEDDFPIQADERRAIQIFVNLLSNAVKFTPENGRIGVQVARYGAAMIGVTVWDTGIGIPEDQQTLIFEKFHQATDNVYSRKEEGTGLGLHISQHLAQQMGGDILLKSVVNEGSEFTVLFRLHQ